MALGRKSSELIKDEANGGEVTKRLADRPSVDEDKRGQKKINKKNRDLFKLPRLI